MSSKKTKQIIQEPVEEEIEIEQPIETPPPPIKPKK